MTALTPTPGAASELQMQKYLNGSDDDLVDVCMQVYSRACRYDTQVLHDVAMAYCAELKRRLRERAPPAPVTEGAQREAVAWRYVNADGKRLSEWKDGTPSNDEKASAGLLSLYIELAHSRPISPPPDRVQPERAEAEASTDDRKQVAAQYLVVATLARNIASVHVDLAGGFVSHVPERMLDMLGARSAEIMETLGDILNGMDAVEESDSWTSQIFDRAHERWPVEQSPAPPNDASGGVTEAMVRTALTVFLCHDPWAGVCGDPDKAWDDMKRALEAADRARKPDTRRVASGEVTPGDRGQGKGWREATESDAEQLVKQYAHQRTQWDSSVIGMLEAMKDVNAVIAEHAPGGEADRG